MADSRVAGVTSELTQCCQEAAATGTLLTLAFDDDEVVTLADPDYGGDVTVLFADGKAAEAAATEAWDGAHAHALDEPWARAWLEGFRGDARFALLPSPDELVMITADALLSGLRAAVMARGGLPTPTTEVGAPEELDETTVDKRQQLDIREQYELLLSECTASGLIWGLRDVSGWVTFNADGAELQPFWAHPSLAAKAATGGWHEARPESVRGEDFLRYLGHLSSTERRLATMLEHPDDWIDMPPGQLAADLLNRRARRRSPLRI